MARNHPKWARKEVETETKAQRQDPKGEPRNWEEDVPYETKEEVPKVEDPCQNQLLAKA